MAERDYTYKAFISYRHIDLDKSVAERLQKKLESYKTPKDLGKREKWRIFRDETELPTSSNLSDDIKTALENSEFLIVICSPATALSRWCMEEITYFKALHGGTNNNIITLLVEGNPQEVFPAELCTTVVDAVDENGAVFRKEVTVEPLAANIASDRKSDALKKLNHEFLRIAAPLIGCGYDDLYNRDRRRKFKTIAAAAAAAFVAVAAFGVYNSVMLMRLNAINEELATKNAELQLKTEELNTSNAELDETNSELDSANSDLEQKNAELDTVNAELSTANSDLQKSNEDLDKSNSQLEAANVELDRSNTALTQSNASLAVKTQEAEDNLTEANNQRDIAEKNLIYAEEQREAAVQNLAYAEEQKTEAEKNLAYAEEQKTAAEENLALVQEKNRELLINGATIAAKNGENEYDNNRLEAIKTLLSVRPYEEDETKLLPSTMRVLANAVGAYNASSGLLLYRTLETQNDIEDCKYNSDYTKFLAYDDNNTVYVWDDDTGELIYKETFNTIDAVEFAGDNSICIATSNGAKSICYEDGSENWSVTFHNRTYYTGIIFEFSSDCSILAMVGYCDHTTVAAMFINTQTGEVISDIEVPVNEEGHLDKVGFFENTKFIFSYYLYIDDARINTSTEFIDIDINSGTYNEVPYETDMKVCEISYYANNEFAFAGLKSAEYHIEESYSSDNMSFGGSAYVVYITDEYQAAVKGVKLDGKERFSTVIEDAGYKMEDVDFQYITWDDYDLNFFSLYFDDRLIFLDAHTGEICDETELKNMKSIYKTSTGGIFYVLCKDGIYGFDLTKPEYIKLYSNNNEETQATQFFVWGKYNKCAVVGTNAYNIRFYRQDEDENYTEFVNSISKYNFTLSKSGEFFTYDNSDDSSIHVYDSQTKEEISVIHHNDEYEKLHISYDYYICNDEIVHLEDNFETNTLYFYNVYTGELTNVMDLDKYFADGTFIYPKICISGDGNKMVIYVSQETVTFNPPSITDSMGFYTVENGLQKIELDENIESALSYMLNNDGSKIVAMIKEKDSDEYKLAVIDVNTGDYINVSDDIDMNLINIAFGMINQIVISDTDLAAVNNNDSITLFDLNSGEIMFHIDDINASQMVFTPDSNSLLAYTNNNILYKYDLQSGEVTGKLSLPLSSDEYGSGNADLTINEQRNEVIVSRSFVTYFVDLDTLEVSLELEDGSYRGFLPLTQEIIMYSSPARFYPYYTSAQLIEMAENIVGKENL